MCFIYTLNVEHSAAKIVKQHQQLVYSLQKLFGQPSLNFDFSCTKPLLLGVGCTHRQKSSVTALPTHGLTDTQSRYSVWVSNSRLPLMPCHAPYTPYAPLLPCGDWPLFDLFTRPRLKGQVLCLHLTEKTRVCSENSRCCLFLPFFLFNSTVH